LLSGPGPGDFLPLSAAISFFAIYALAAAGQPSLLTRFLTCRDTATIRRACFIIGVYILLLYPAVMTLGVVGRALVPELEAADHAMPATILAATPAALAGVLLAAPFAAIMSTVSSYLLVTSSAVVRDLYARNRTGVLSESRAETLTYCSTFGLAGLTLVFALQPPAFLQYIVIFAGTGLAATFLFPTLFAIYWPRMNHAGFVAGMTAGFVSFVAQYALWGTRSVGGFDPFVWSLIVSAAFSAGGVRLGKRTSAKTLEIYFDGDAISWPIAAQKVLPAQAVAATQASKRSAGVSNSSVFRGRPFSLRAILSRCSCECTDKSVPLGKYCLNRPLVFSFDPRCQGL